MWNRCLLALLAVAACVSAVDEGLAPLKELGETEVDTAKTQATTGRRSVMRVQAALNASVA